MGKISRELQRLKIERSRLERHMAEAGGNVPMAAYYLAKLNKIDRDIANLDPDHV